MSIIRNDINVDRDVEVKMISLADRLRQEGRQEGIEKGIEKGAFLKAVETCKKALMYGATPEFASQITGIPLQKVLEIQKSITN